MMSHQKLEFLMSLDWYIIWLSNTASDHLLLFQLCQTNFNFIIYHIWYMKWNEWIWDKGSLEPLEPLERAHFVTIRVQVWAILVKQSVKVVTFSPWNTLYFLKMMKCLTKIIIESSNFKWYLWQFSWFKQDHITTNQTEIQFSCYPW